MNEQAPIRVLIVDDIADTRENLKKLLLFEKGIEVVGAAASGEQGIELGRQLRPDVVLMDINMPGIDGITAAETISREVPGVQIIMMSVQGEADYLRRSMLAGAREFLIKPFSADELAASIRRVHALGRPAPAPAAIPQFGSFSDGPTGAPVNSIPGVTGPFAPAPPRAGVVIAVFGAKGGVGASVLVTNLAIALHEATGKARVAVVDGDLQFGDVGVLLNLNNERSIVELCEHIDEIDAQYLSDVMATHASGIKALLAPPSPEMADLVTADHLKRILALLRNEFDYVLIDTATSFGEITLTLLDLADNVLLVTTTEIPAIKNARLFFEISNQLKYDEEKVLLILNKYDSRGGITATAIQDSIKHPVVATVSRDDRTVNAAMNQGLPFVVSQPRSQVSLDLFGLARTLAASEAQESPVPPPVRRPEPAAKKQSLFRKIFNR